tara:strand:- start:110 stop:721 length:612 start_codon:yes stop_codon:yes gene_type:complete
MSIELIESDDIILKKIHTAYASAVDKYLVKSSNRIINNLKPVLIRAIQSSPEMSSVTSGILRADFGLTSNPAFEIASAVAETITIQNKKTKVQGKNIKGGLILNAQPSDYSNLFGLPSARQQIIGGSLPWLEWLLTLGDSVIIANYTVEYGPYGRTGKARMTESGRPFKVDSAYSGSSRDNFITRAIERNKSLVINAIIKGLE